MSRNADTSTATIHLDRSRLKGELCSIPGSSPPAFRDTQLENRPRDSWLRDNYKRPTADMEVYEQGRSPAKMAPCNMGSTGPWERERTAAHAAAGPDAAWRAAYGAKDAEICASHPTTKHVFSAGVVPPRLGNLSPGRNARMAAAGDAVCTPRKPPPVRPDEGIVGNVRARNTTRNYRFDRHFYFVEKPFLTVPAL